MNSIENFHQSAQAWIEQTGGATLPDHVISQHPALNQLEAYAVDTLAMDEGDAAAFSASVLRGITRSADGGLLWRHDSPDALLEHWQEWGEDRADLAADGIGLPPENHPERHQFAIGYKLTAGAVVDDAGLEEVRQSVMECAPQVAGGEPPAEQAPSYLAPELRPEQPSQAFWDEWRAEVTKRRESRQAESGAVPKPAPAEKPASKPKHQHWLDSLLEDDDAALERIAAQPMLVENLIPAGSLGYIFGASGVGKSFVTLDLCHAVATGRPWLGDDDFSVEEPGLVVYVAGEGADGVRVRKRALEQETGIRAPRLRILPAAPLMDGKDGHLLAETLKELESRMGEPVRLVVLDTLSQTMEGDQNAADATSAFIRGCAEVQSVGATVAVVHHTGHGDGERMRGSTNLKAAGDFEFAVKGSTETTVSIHQTKSKDLEALPGALVLKAHKVTVEGIQRRNGEAFTSLVMKPANLAEQINASRQLSANEQMLLDALMEAGDGQAVTIGDARKAFCEAKGGKIHSARQAFSRAKRGLCDRHMIQDDGELIHPTVADAS